MKPNEALQINCNFSNLVKIIDDHVDKEEDLENPRSRSGWMPPLQRSIIIYT